MTERDAIARQDAREVQPDKAGALLRDARESAGMSIDAVASHLKLAPRQVKALEDGDYTRLPGRTFIRGFVRNYARLVHLDAEQVLSALPGGGAASALEAPTLHSTAQTMGELPTTDHSKTPWARWAIPAVLAAIVAAAAIYEWRRPAGEAPASAQKDAAPALMAPAPSAPAVAPSTVAAGTALPNPLASNPPTQEGAPSASAISANPAAPAATDASPSAATGTTPPATALPSGGEQTVVIAFHKSAWAEIRDRDGRLLLTGTQAAGATQTVSGTPPLALKIGNAGDVSLRYRGEPVDLAPFTQKNVARLTLR